MTSGALHVHVYDEAPSTNAIARTLAEDGAPHGTLVIAKRQTQGRGRLGRVWHDGGCGNCMASLILRPSTPIQYTPMVCLAAGVAIQKECGAAVGLKWPNDLVDRELRKVGGILAEMETNGQTVQFVIVGFGVNVVSTPTAAPNPVSLADLGIMIEAEAFARRCATNLVQWVDHLSQSARREELLAAWRAVDFIDGKAVRIGAIHGRACGVDHEGSLRVMSDTGQLQLIRAGDVEMVSGF